MEDFEAIQQRIETSDVVLSNSLYEMQSLSRKFSMFAHEHDVNEYYKLNGYRSMIRITDKYFSKLRAAMEAKEPDAGLAHLRAAAPTLVSLMKLMLHIHEQGDTDEESLEDFAQLLQFKEQDVQPFHTEVRGFYLRPGLRSLMNGVVMGVVLTNISLINLVRMLLSSQAKGRLFATLALNGSITDVRNLWGPAEFGGN